MLNIKNIVIGLLLLLSLGGGLFWFARNQNSEVKISGLLNAKEGELYVEDGYYDMRIVTYDTKTGELLAVEDYADVDVQDALYTVDYRFKDISASDKIYYQLCRSATPSMQPDGLNESNLPVRCESLAQSDSSLPIVECPKTLVVNKDNLFGSTSSYATPNCIDNETTVAVVDFAGSNTEKESVKAVFATPGPQGEKGEKGDKGDTGEKGIVGATGVQGFAGDPATDDQTIIFGGASILSISGGNSVDLSSLLDNTDELASLLCANSEVPLMTLGVWACGTTSGVDTDDQTLSLIANNLSIDNGNSVSLLSYLDNTDAQAISIASNILSISGNASTVNLAGYLDNTDSQDLSLGGTTLTLTGDGTAVSLASLLDNTDVLASLSCSFNQIAKWNGSAWACSADADTDTVLNEFQVDSYVANNGYLTSEVDGSVSNELQNLTFASNVLGLTSSGVTFNLSAYLDNTDVLASLSCSNGQVAQWNGSAWVCATTGGVDTDDQTLSLITNTLSIDSGNSVSLASYLDNTDAQSIALNSNIISISGNASTVDLSAYLDNTDTQDLSLVTNTLSLVDGGSVDLSAYLDDTDTDTQDLSLLGNTLSLVAGGSVDLSAYLDDTDNQDLTLTGDTLALTNDGTTIDLSGYLDNTDNQNLFLTINADNGTDPVADSVTDALNFVSGAGVTITGDSTTDTLTIAAVLGATIDDSAEIVDGTIANGDLANSSLTVTAGNGLTTGGSVSLGSTVTLDIGAGTGITVNANDIAITTDGLNFTELSDALSLDASTTISLGTNNLTTNLNGTGDYAIQFGGNTVLSILDTGAVAIGNILSDQTIGVDNGTGAINISTDSDANTTNIGTGTGADTVTIGDVNANVALTDAQWSISGAGAASFASVSGAGLTDCDGNDDVLKWDTTTGQFSCGTNRATFHNVLDGNYTNNTTGFTEVDNNADATDDIGFAIGANETWVFESSNQLASNTTADSKWQVTAPAGATCDISVSNIEQAISVSNLACTTSTGNIAVAAADTNEVTVSGVVTTGATAGNVIVNFGQNTASGTSTIYAGSFITAYRVSGADYAEVYYSEDRMSKGMIAQLSGNGPSQIKTADSPYSDQLVGIYSTQPGNVIGEADGNGQPVPIALSGRVPILISTENGLPKAGDMITSSATIPGYGMLANKSGYIVGQLMVDAVDNGDGTAQGYVYVRHGYWQAPITIDLGLIIGQNTTTQLGGNVEEQLGLNGITAIQYNSLDQDAVNEILRGFAVQQDQINVLSARIDTLEQPSSVDSTGLLSLLSFDNDAVSFLNDVIFDKNVYFSGSAVFNKDMVGVVTVPAGETVSSVKFNQLLNYTPTVTLTPNSFIQGSWRITNVADSGFIVELLEPQEKESVFSWQVIQTR